MFDKSFQSKPFQNLGGWGGDLTFTIGQMKKAYNAIRSKVLTFQETQHKSVLTFCSLFYIYLANWAKQEAALQTPV